MSGMSPCPSCGNEVAWSAFISPSCGHAFKLPNAFSWRTHLRDVGQVLMFGILPALAFALIASLGREPQKLFQEKKGGGAANCAPETVPIFSDWRFRGTGDGDKSVM